ncbi:TIGR04283 family arsenosugar biosynthesis glycosyltransferase [Megalodesulfovibrio paquesii]
MSAPGDEHAGSGIPTGTSRPLLSVIIPALHEAARINDCLQHVKRLARPEVSGRPLSLELLVVDADDAGDTLAAIEPSLPTEEAGRSAPVTALASPRGRALQMNAGAARARGQALLFLHADTRLPQQGLGLVWHALFPEDGSTPAAAGAFSLGYAGGSGALQCMARLACWRNRLLGTPYGDQAHFFRAVAFHDLGGYPVIPIMEDVAIMQAVRKLGLRLVILPERVATSARRYRAGGLLRTGLRNNCLRLLYACGVSPQALNHWYRAHRDTP